MGSRLNSRVLTAEPSDMGERLDRWLGERLEDLTRSAVQKLCTDGLVCAEGQPLSKNYRLRGTERVTTNRRGWWYILPRETMMERW